MFPARAGMDRSSCRAPTWTPACSPPARGWTDGNVLVEGELEVFPARAGMEQTTGVNRCVMSVYSGDPSEAGRSDHWGIISSGCCSLTIRIDAGAFFVEW